MRKLIPVVAIFISISFFISCRGRDGEGSSDANNTSGEKADTDSTRGFPDANATPADQTQAANQESIAFVTKAASGGMLEVQLGQLAQQKAKNERVKNFGSMMISDHSRANEELKALASSKNITIPASLLPDHQKHLDMMSKMSGADFDKHYMSMMVSDHEKDVNEFKQESNSSGNDPFKAFAGKTLPVLQKHLDSAKAINGKL